MKAVFCVHVCKQEGVKTAVVMTLLEHTAETFTKLKDDFRYADPVCTDFLVNYNSGNLLLDPC